MSQELIVSPMLEKPIIYFDTETTGVDTDLGFLNWFNQQGFPQESKNKIKIMPKNSPKYLDKLKECKNISHIFIDNLKGRIYNRK